MKLKDGKKEGRKEGRREGKNTITFFLYSSFRF